MTMNVDLKYFSGTGNSYKILETCKETFVKSGCNVRLSSITDKTEINRNADLIGFCFPVYAFAIPRICRKYLCSLPKFKNQNKTFVLVTAGDKEESGVSVEECSNILKIKGLNVVYSSVVQMPSNWTVSMNPPSKEEAQTIINDGIDRARKIAEDMLRGKSLYHHFNFPPGYSKFGFYKDYLLFKWLGVSNLWRKFRTDETCDCCHLCVKICPTDSIQIVDNKPRWSRTCEQCMRCVNYCPKQAIFQLYQQWLSEIRESDRSCSRTPFCKCLLARRQNFRR